MGDRIACIGVHDHRARRSPSRSVGHPLQRSEIAGLALSTTSVAVVYAVMIESGLASQEIGKLILAACFVTDLGTVLFLGLLFADVSPLLLVFAAATAGAVLLVPRLSRLLTARVAGRVSEPEIKFLFVVLFALGGLAQMAGSEAVLPAYLVGLAVAGVFVADRVLVHRMRATAFSLLTPFYFLKAGSLVALPAIAAGAGLIGLFLTVKLGAKALGIWPMARAFGLATRDANYTTLLMSTGLTFGTIAALYGLTNGFIDQPTYSVLVTVVILSAVVPTLIATTFFEPQAAEADALRGLRGGRGDRRGASPATATYPSSGDAASRVLTDRQGISASGAEGSACRRARCPSSASTGSTGEPRRA